MTHELSKTFRKFVTDKPIYMKQLALLILILVLAAVMYVGGMLLLGLATKYKPATVEELNTQKAVAETQAEKQNLPAGIGAQDTVLSFLIWNIGYGGLGKEVDFFYDGGKTVTSPREHVMKNNEGIVKNLAGNHRDVDFVMLQEVDRCSKRSYKIDQAKNIAEALPQHRSTFTPNYDVVFLPFPFIDPIGKVYGGLQTLSRFMPEKSERIALPGISDFPKKIFYLERCLLVQRYALPNGKKLIIINTHYEAYDDGSVKKQQMELTKKLVEEEYAKGNYVVIGGDWNIAPPDFNVHSFEKEKEDDPLYLMNNDKSFMPGWSYAYDSTIATNRKNKTAFDPAKTFTTVIDYYLLSPNIEIVSVKGQDMGFDYSDHQPVKMKVKLK